MKCIYLPFIIIFAALSFVNNDLVFFSYKQRNAISLVSTVCSLWSALMWCEKHCEQVTHRFVCLNSFSIRLSHYHIITIRKLLQLFCHSVQQILMLVILCCCILYYFFLFWFEPSSPKIKNNYLASGKRQKSCNRITKTNY